jgi:hypothetical protein
MALCANCKYFDTSDDEDPCLSCIRCDGGKDNFRSAFEDVPLETTFGSRADVGFSEANREKSSNCRQALDKLATSGIEVREFVEAIESVGHVETHPLQQAFDACIQQVTKGKGEIHGGETEPFFNQPWHQISKRTGIGGLMFQAEKKLGEANGKPTRDAFERELLGAIAYTAMAYLYSQKYGFKGETK